MTALVQALMRATSLPMDDHLKSITILSGIGLLCSLVALLLGWNLRFM